MQKKIISIIGARPQFIKHAPMQIELEKVFNALTIHTGQHFDENMSKVFFDELHISQPEYLLSLDAKSQGAQTAQMMIEIEKICLQEKPDAVLVYGDTNSTLAGAIVSAKLQIPIIHIEAGLRSFNKEMPEEINRIMTDHVSTLLFCPSLHAVENLKNEGITNNVFISGDVMKDTMNLCIPFIKKIVDYSYYFATIHRPYNTDELERILEILKIFNSLNEKVVFAIHPRTSNFLKSKEIDFLTFENIEFINPQSYTDSISYQKNALAVITDSGGMQKEAYWLQKPCITIRKETEWVETLQDGCNTLFFENLSEISEYLESLKNKRLVFKSSLYGTENSSSEIVKIITNFIND